MIAAPPLLDTHVWVWWIRHDPRLEATIVGQLDGFGSDERPFVADISLWEVAMLVETGRLELPGRVGQWLESATHPRTIRVVPISAAIAAETTAARSLRDPAYRLIVATSRVFDLPLFTHDRNILRSKLARRWVPQA